MYELNQVVPENKKIRVIIDTDAACEADDPFAIVHGLLSPKLIVKAILAEHFNEEGSVEQSYAEMQTILRSMKLSVPVYMGEAGPRTAGDRSVSSAAAYIVEEALKDAPHPLFVLCQGAITNVAAALEQEPVIRDRMTIVWIGTHGIEEKPAPFREFNAGNDIQALSSGANIWLIPSNVYTTMHVGLAELQYKVYPCGEIGRHLYENMIRYNLSEKAGWTQGESWSLGDSPAIGVALNPGCGSYLYAPAPYIKEDTSSVVRPENPVIRIYQTIDSRYILEDFFSKLWLFAEHQ